jgi:ubiquinone/menaquinone biosynthesis C-methylase UbiE
MHPEIQSAQAMSDRPNAAAQTEDFEFTALAEAKNYRRALIEEFRRELRGEVIEAGAGIGQITEALLGIPEVRRVVAVEPDAGFCRQFRARLPTMELIEGTVADLPTGTACEAILCINVLEHIREDTAEMARFAELLKARRGALCLFVPARPEIYAPIDKDFGHFRRYTRPELRKKLIEAGFAIERLHYFNFVGYFAWWANFCLLKKRAFEVQKVRAFDRLIFPAVHAVESKLMRPPFGQSLLAIARAA